MCITTTDYIAFSLLAAPFSTVEKEPSKRNHVERKNGLSSTVWKCLNLAMKGFVFLFLGLVTLLALTTAIASPPMHLFYDVAPAAGPSSVYVPGNGFAGFWFHLGMFQTMENLRDYDYYCYSSGCLSILVALLEIKFEDIFDTCFGVQDAWRQGHVTRFELVDMMLDGILPEVNDPSVGNGHSFDSNITLTSNVLLEEILPHLKILVTTDKEGVVAAQASNREELRDLLIKTTWIPYITGWGILADTEKHTNERRMHFDGGFSRVIHPECEFRVDLPLNIYTLLHTFNHALTRGQVSELWNLGFEFNHPLMTDPHQAGNCSTEG